MPRSQAHALAPRARSQFERSLGPLLLARSEREHCPELAAILDDQGSKASPSLRWRVRRHFRRCEVCGVRKRGGLNPAILLGLLPAIPLPADLRRQTLGLILDRSSTAVAYRGRVLERAARFGAGGFAVQLTTPLVPGRRVTAVAAVAAAAAALVLLGGAMYFAAQASGHDPAPSAVDRRPPLTGPTGPSGSTRAPAGVPSAGVRTTHAAPGVGPAMYRLGASGPAPLLGLLGAVSTGPPALGSASAGRLTSPSRRLRPPGRLRRPSRRLRRRRLRRRRLRRRRLRRRPLRRRRLRRRPLRRRPLRRRPLRRRLLRCRPSVSVSVSVSLPRPSAPATSSSSATGGP